VFSVYLRQNAERYTVHSLPSTAQSIQHIHENTYLLARWAKLTGSELNSWTAFIDLNLPGDLTDKGILSS